jgi:alcohol dehydrogenase class IV
MNFQEMLERCEFHIPTRILFGLGTANQVGEIATSYGARKALLFTDQGLVRAGIVDIVLNSLQLAGLSVAVWDRVRGNPTVELFLAAADFFKEAEADLLIAIGGGSSIDIAKIVGILDSNPQPLLTLEGYGKARNRRRLPLIAIETAAGSGAEVSEFAMIRDVQRGLKVGVNGPYMFPDVAICDPLLTRSLPPRDTAEIGLDALSNAIESYITRRAWPVSEALSLEGMRLIFTHLRMAVEHGDHLPARAGMMAGSLLAGMAMGVGLGIPHALAESIGGLYGQNHGLTVALSLPVGLKFCLPACWEKMARVARIAGEDTGSLSVQEAAKRAIRAVQCLIADLAIPTAQEAGCQKADIPAVLDRVLQHDCIHESPRLPTESDLRQMLEELFQP